MFDLISDVMSSRPLCYDEGGWLQSFHALAPSLMSLQALYAQNSQILPAK